MTIEWLLMLHIAVLGYWLGSELVINSTYRYVCYAAEMPFVDRSRLMDHVMHVYQHVRYALVLQASLGTALLALYGYVPGHDTVAIIAGVVGVIWLAFVEAVHQLRHKPIGKRLAAIDRGSRYLMLAVLVLIAFGLLGADWELPGWMRWKLGLYAGVIASGVGIRFALISHFRTWAIMAAEGPTDATNRVIRQTYVRATAVLVLLWVFIAALVYFSVVKPG